METGRQDGGSDKNHAPFSVGKTGNISRKFLTIILKIFDKNFERLQKYFANTLPDEHIPQETEILTETIKWLDMYFSGEEPNFTPPLHPSGSSFRQAVWQILLQIPYGQTITYGEIARKIAETKNTSRMSAQAVGGAVGHNEISIIIPCHRVVGTNGSLTGYAGGIDKKISLLELEHTDMSRFFVPKKGTAL